MTRCDELNRWLDEGMPEADAAGARAHAAACPRCAEAMEAFETVERALALPPRPIPEGAAFTARVMERVSASAPLPIPAATAKRQPWWLALFAEPGFAVAAAAGIALVLTPLALHFDANRSIALPVSVAGQAFGAMLGATLAGWFSMASFAEQLTPLSRLSLLIGFAPLLTWAGLWMFGAVERLVRGLPARRG